MTIDNNKFQHEQINLWGGDLKLFRRAPWRECDEGGVWQMKVWIHKDQKYFRKSLRTKDEDFARTKAEKEYRRILVRIDSDQEVFEKNLHKVIDEYLELQKANVGVNKTLGRYQTIVSQTKHMKKFHPDYKMSECDPNVWEDYYSWRKNKKPNVQNVTLLNEKATINAVFRFAVTRGFIRSSFIPNWQHLEKVINRREALTIEEYRTITNTLRKKEFLEYEYDSNYHRHFVRYFILLLANTGLRFGEARRLKWQHIKVYRRRDDDRVKLCEISLSADMTKNKKARKVQGRRGDIFEKIKEFSNYTSPNDYIFVDNNSGQQLGRDYYYKAWKHMMKLSGLDKGIKHMSFYNLRHTYATWRLYLPNVNIRALCENLGTGLQYLEEHYGQVKTQVERERLTADLPDEVKEDLLEYG